jgi:hypothetical protein
MKPAICSARVPYRSNKTCTRSTGKPVQAAMPSILRLISSGVRWDSRVRRRWARSACILLARFAQKLQSLIGHLLGKCAEGCPLAAHQRINREIQTRPISAHGLDFMIARDLPGGLCIAGCQRADTAKTIDNISRNFNAGNTRRSSPGNNPLLLPCN